MNIAGVNLKTVLNDAELVVLANSGETEAGQLIYKVVTLIRDKGREVNEERPKIDDGDLRRDFRTVNGQISTCNNILDLPRAARTIIQKGERQ